MNKEALNTKLSLVVVITVIFVIPLSRLYPFDPTYTYNFHIEIAQRMALNHSIESPHFLYQALIIFVHTLAPYISFNVAGFYIVPLVTYCVLGLVIQSYISRALLTPQSSEKSLFYSIFSILITLALMVVTPISLLTYPRLYLGYIGIAMYHSATTLLAKPLSLLAFTSITKVLSQPGYQSKKVTLYLSIITVLSLIAKPNYIICIVPATLLVIAYKLYRKHDVNWLPIVLGLFVPSIIVLGWQFFLAYQNEQTLILGGKSSIIFAPLVVMSYLSKARFSEFSINGLIPLQTMDCKILGFMYSCELPKDFLLSIVFPICVYILYFDKTRKNADLNFAWLAFLISVFYVYFLAESGGRIYAGNFLWSGQLSLFVLFVVSTVFLLQQQDFKAFLNTEIKIKFFKDFCLKFWKTANNLWQLHRVFLCICTFGLHFISGLVYLVFVTETGWL